MSTPRTKRQFAGAASDPAQRQITAFFSKVPSPAPVDLRPVLPAETESNLLTVGMRVRKSVPEGYKTGNHCAFGLSNDRVPTTSMTTAKAPVASSAPCSSQRELLPFCAINNIGGLTAQPSTANPSLFFQRAALPSIDDIPLLSCSQDSLDSTTPTSSSSLHTTSPTRLQLSSRKRSYDAGDESDTPSISTSLQVPSGKWMDGEVSPRSLTPVGDMWSNTRVMAVPRRARQSLKARGGGGAVRIMGGDDKTWREMVGQENVDMELDADLDFPEADFLDYAALEGDAMEM